MPRYYFDFLDERGRVVDDEGRDLQNTQAVQVEAARSLIDMARDSLLDVPSASIDRLIIEVRDEAGPVMTLRFRFEIEKTN